MKKRVLYFAGPSVFLKSGNDHYPSSELAGNHLKNLAVTFGFNGVYPGDSKFISADDIYVSCVESVFNSDAVIADIGGWRGPEMDTGTAFEMGLAIARGIPVFGYGYDIDKELIQKLPPTDQYDTENFGLPQNLMVCKSCISIHETSREAVIAAYNYFNGVK